VDRKECSGGERVDMDVGDRRESSYESKFILELVYIRSVSSKIFKTVCSQR